VVIPASFADSVAVATGTVDSPLCIGLDPMLHLLPQDSAAAGELGTDDAVARIEAFCRHVLEAVHGIAGIVKPQSAFFERYGPAGVACFERVSRAAKALGYFVIADAKRGDIASTAEAYADAYFSPKQDGRLIYDALTVNPYFGSDGIRPFVDRAAAAGGGVFVLVKTSNPSSAELQDRLIDGEPLYRVVARKVSEWGGGSQRAPLSAVGAVVGATHPAVLEELRREMPRTIFLIPGVGAQGGTHDAAACGFLDDGRGAIVNVSRSVLYPWSTRGDGQAPESWREMVRDAARNEAALLRRALEKRARR
jgi:orotidine-5'-phosphate decarboxylase